jgi:hypothetical protein
MKDREFISLAGSRLLKMSLNPNAIIYLIFELNILLIIPYLLREDLSLYQGRAP